MILEGL